MLAEALTVIGRDNQPCPLEHPPVLEFVDQLTQLFVETGETVIVRVASEGDLPFGRPLFHDLGPVTNDGQLTVVARASRTDGCRWAEVDMGDGHHRN